MWTVKGCMAEKVQPGQYIVGEYENTPSRDPPKTIGVIRGDVANESRDGRFHRIIGLSDSKWYLYEGIEEIRKYNDRSGTGVLMVTNLIEEFSSKSSAVREAEKLYNL